jgi:isocitrate dehydrogenase (NAD+)
MQLVVRPEQFQVLVLENLYGDIVSDLVAGLVGGLGVVGGANIGESTAVFEAVHGSAPDIAGQNKANPTALLQSAILMLDHIGEREASTRIYDALVSGRSTSDIGGSETTSSFAKAICDAIEKS